MRGQERSGDNHRVHHLWSPESSHFVKVESYLSQGLPASVQEMSDFVVLGFELAFKYRNPAMVLADGVIGQMMEKVVLPDYTPRWTDEEIEKISGDWALTGKKKNRNHHIITSLELEAHRQEVFNEKLQRKYREIEANEVRYEALNCEDADYIFVAYGSCARICQKSIQLARQEGIKVGLLRPITLLNLKFIFQCFHDLFRSRYNTTHTAVEIYFHSSVDSQPYVFNHLSGTHFY